MSVDYFVLSGNKENLKKNLKCVKKIQDQQGGAPQ